MSNMKLSVKMTLYNSYFDINDNLTPRSILSIFQDVASIHAEDIGVGYKSMLDKNLYWILTRIKYDIIKMPKINEIVTIETWPHKKGRIDFDRDMKILNQNGEVLIVATSKWCVIDTVKRMLQRTDNVIYSGECIDEVNYNESFTKISLPNDDLKYKYDYDVKFSDLDHNKHMNNTKYSDIITNVVISKCFNHFEINYINETLLNDKIQIYYIGSENEEYVIGKNGEKIVFVSMIK